MKSSIKPKSSLIQEDRKDEELEVFVLAHKYSHGSDLGNVIRVTAIIALMNTECLSLCEHWF